MKYSVFNTANTLSWTKDTIQIQAGTEEGYVCLFEIQEEGLIYHKVFDKQEGELFNILVKFSIFTQKSTFQDGFCHSAGTVRVNLS